MPGKHRNRKRNRPRRIQLQINRNAIPRDVGDEGSIKILKSLLRTGDPLPEGWDVSIDWRNPNTKVGRSKDWQSGDWDTVLAESAGSTGFASAVANALRVAGGQAPVRPKTPSDKRQLTLFESPAPKAKRAARAKQQKLTAKQLEFKRAAASRKGWATRRANQAAKGKTK